MKKFLTLLLASIMLLSLCACGGEKTEEQAGKRVFSVGVSRINITPQNATNLPMEGYKDQISQGILSFLYATCVAITDEQNNTLLLYTVDRCESERETVDELRSRLEASTGIPGDNISVSSTHTHSSPKISSMPDYVDQLVQVGEEALADRAPATIVAGSYDVPNMNFVRHYVLNDGTVAGDNFGDKSVGYKDHTSVADPNMRLIRFQREEKKDVLMVNWQVHPRVASSGDTQEGRATRNLLSSDFVGYAREHVEAKEDVIMAYYTGASGNVNHFSHLTAEKGLVSKEAKVYGQQFGDHVITAMKELKSLPTGNVGSKSAPLGAFKMHAYTLGSSIGFATVPAEIFHETGSQIREGSGCELTFVMSCTNGRNTYIPIEEVWSYTTNNSDLPYEMSICRYPKGTAEELAATLGQMLTELVGK